MKALSSSSLSLWMKCLLVSIVLHASALYVFLRNPTLWQGTLGSFFTPSSPIAIQTEEKEYTPSQVLDEFFATYPDPLPLQEHSTPSLDSYQSALCLLPEKNITSPFPSLALVEQPISTESLLVQIPAFPPPPLPSIQEPLFAKPSSPPSPFSDIDFAFAEETFEVDGIVDDLIMADTLLLPRFHAIEEEPLERSTSFLATATFPPLSTSSAPLSPIKRPIPASSPPLAQEPKAALPQANIATPPGLLTPLDSYLPAEALFAARWKDLFHIDTTFFPAGDEYVFSFTLTPLPNATMEKIPQNISFLIDVSSQIEKHKISVFKQATIKALSALGPGDLFNIFLLDKKVVSFSPEPVPFSTQVLRQVEEFLQKKEDRPLFTSHHLLSSLEEVLSRITPLSPSEILHTAVLLSNGKHIGEPAAYKNSLRSFLTKNEGLLSLFTATVGHSNDLLGLDMLSALSGGKLLYSDTNASFPRKLTQFVKTLQNPLIRDISLAIYTDDPKAHITLFPEQAPTPALYAGEPFIVMGTISRLSPLRLSLEGIGAEGWVIVEKDISFEEGTSSTVSIKKEWQRRQAASLYIQFLENPTMAYLEQAREFLHPAYGKVLLP